MVTMLDYYFACYGGMKLESNTCSCKVLVLNDSSH
jgi:hypothetical protein